MIPSFLKAMSSGYKFESALLVKFTRQNTFCHYRFVSVAPAETLASNGRNITKQKSVARCTRLSRTPQSKRVWLKILRDKNMITQGWLISIRSRQTVAKSKDLLTKNRPFFDKGNALWLKTLHSRNCACRMLALCFHNQFQRYI